MGSCNHEEADTRVVVHLLHALQSSSVAMIYTGDTDVVVIVLSNYHHFMAVNSGADIWILFKAGKQTKMIHMNAVASVLGETTCKGLALFHALTGSDTTSSFKFKGKRYCFKTKNKVPSIMEEFAIAANTPFHISPKLNDAVMRFVCILYSNADENNVNLVRMRMFCQKTRDIERIPPTSDALVQHIKRSIFQASIWTTAYDPQTPDQQPINHRWMERDNKFFPIGTTISLAKDVFDFVVKCSCKKSVFVMKM